ncbi:MAG TPA: (2Fe-2S)-binding protein [Phycisphaerae bacterium]|nr:(2Fe-2S)-binding protein [Phycisphaerae bacterium]
MDLDDHVCCCHHVSLRKLLSYARRKRPRHASQLSSCLNAGTGCGWCIPVLKRIHEAALGEAASGKQLVLADLPATAEEYAAARQAYLKCDNKNTF